MTNQVTLNSGTAVERLASLKQRKPQSELLHGIKTKERIDKVLVVILDSSGSMSDSIESGIRKIDAAWQVFQNELSPNMANWTYGVLIFQGHNEVFWEIYPCQDTQALKVIRKPAAMGGTPMRRALETAWQWTMHNAKQARFILLSDGCPTDSGTEDILRLAKEYSTIPIDTVGVGSTINSNAWFPGYNPEFLRELSRITGGEFFEVGSVKLLGETIKRISPAERPLLGPVGGL